MEVEYFKWDEFKMEVLHQQIQTGSVAIGFQVKETTIIVHGKPDPENKGLWTAYASIDKAGSKRTFSKKSIKPEDVAKEFEQNINTARGILAGIRPS